MNFRSIFERAFVIAVLVLLSAPADAATEKWRRGSECNSPTTGELDKAAHTFPGEVITFCPNSKTDPSPPLHVRQDGVCQWYDAASGTDLVVTYAFSGVERHGALGGVPCIPATIGACATFDIYKGDVLVMAQNAATANTKLVCGTGLE